MEIRLIIFLGLAAAALLAKLFFQRAYAALKPLPIVLIIILAALKPGPIPTLWFAAISFGLAGDLFLLRADGFIPGLLSFLLGHIFYILALTHAAGGVYFTPPLLLGVGSIAVGIFLYLTRHLIQSRRKKYIVPILLYVTVTSILIINAFRYPLASMVVAGAVAFGLSDFLLAFNKFVRPNRYADAGVSVTYYTAQWLLAIHFRAI